MVISFFLLFLSFLVITQVRVRAAREMVMTYYSLLQLLSYCFFETNFKVFEASLNEKEKIVLLDKNIQVKYVCTLWSCLLTNVAVKYVTRVFTSSDCDVTRILKNQEEDPKSTLTRYSFFWKKKKLLWFLFAFMLWHN